MHSDKKIVHYTFSDFHGYDNPVGKGVSVITTDHPGPFSYGEVNGDLLDTSTVTAYDETTGIFETRNTVYVPTPEIDKEGAL